MGTSTNERPALAGRQLDDAVNVSGIDMVDLAGDAVNQFAVPTAVWIQVEHLFDIVTVEDIGVETPGMIMRRRMRLFHLEPVQRASVIQMVFGKRPRHALHTDDPRAVGKPPLPSQRLRALSRHGARACCPERDHRRPRRASHRS